MFNRLVALMLAAVMLAACQVAVDLPFVPRPPAPTAPNAPTTGATPISLIGERDPQMLSDTFFTLLQKSGYTAAEDDFDATMKSKLGPDALKQVWEGLINQVGAYQKPLGVRKQVQAPYYTVITTLQFERAALDMRVVVDMNTGLITGLFFTPNQNPASVQATAEATYSPPWYADHSRFTEREVTVGAAPWALSGTLSLPMGHGPFPVVVLVHGSGPNDRDETVGLNKPFRDLAWGLATGGVAVLRYEKRTRTYGARMAHLTTRFTVKEETTDDAHAAVTLVRQLSDIDPQRIYVLGHSLGGMLIPRIGQADPDLAGLIIMAGPTRPLQTLVVEQTSYLTSLHGAPTDQDKAALEQARQMAAAIDTLTPADAASNTRNLIGAPPSYWLDLRGYKPAEVARTLPQRILILQGGRDYQVTQDDLKGWQDALEARSNVQITLFPDLNHLFATGQGKSMPEEYNQHGHVAAPVIARIVEWIH